MLAQDSPRHASAPQPTAHWYLNQPQCPVSVTPTATFMFKWQLQTAPQQAKPCPLCPRRRPIGPWQQLIGDSLSTYPSGFLPPTLYQNSQSVNELGAS
jgi:hypothetical protein